jgi:hypothetical protein
VKVLKAPVEEEYPVNGLLDKKYAPV